MACQCNQTAEMTMMMTTTMVVMIVQRRLENFCFCFLPSVLAIVLHSRQEDDDEVEATEKINKRFADFPNPIALLLISLCSERYLQNLLNIVFIKTQSNKDGHKIC